MTTPPEFELDPEPPYVDRIAVCRTEGCSMNGVEVAVRLYENADGIYRCICGVCSVYITDLKEVPA
jgi:hypothetical protein